MCAFCRTAEWPLIPVATLTLIYNDHLCSHLGALFGGNYGIVPQNSVAYISKLFLLTFSLSIYMVFLVFERIQLGY